MASRKPKARHEKNKNYAPEFIAEVMQIVCERMAGGDLVVEIAEELGVESRRIREWALRDEWRDTYRLAREMQAHALAEGAITLADNESIPAESRRIRVDTRKWYTGKIAPKTFGDRSRVEHTGEDGQPIQVEERQVLVFGDKKITF